MIEASSRETPPKKRWPASITSFEEYRLPPGRCGGTGEDSGSCCGHGDTLRACRRDRAEGSAGLGVGNESCSLMDDVGTEGVSVLSENRSLPKPSRTSVCSARHASQALRPELRAFSRSRASRGLRQWWARSR